jgi:hypothetical protein
MDIINDIKNKFFYGLNKIIIDYIGVITFYEEYQREKYQYKKDVERLFYKLPDNCIELIKDFRREETFEELFDNDYGKNFEYRHGSRHKRRNYGNYLENLVYNDYDKVDRYLHTPKEDKPLEVDNLISNEYWNMISIEQMETCLNGNPDFGRKNSATLFRGTPGTITANPVVRAWINKLLKPSEIIRYVELEIGGSRIDKIYGSIFDVLYEIHNLKYTVEYQGKGIYYYEIPLPIDALIGSKGIITLQYHEVRLYFEFMDQPKGTEIKEIDIKYNHIMMEPTKKFKDICPDRIVTAITQIQYTGEEIISGGVPNFTYRLGFNHETNLLVIFFEDQNNKLIEEEILDSIELDLDKNYLLGYKPKKLYNMPGKYFVPLTDEYNYENAVNFSKVDREIIKLMFKEPTMSKIYCYIFGFNVNDLMVGRMAGIRDSKLLEYCMGGLKWSR